MAKILIIEDTRTTASPHPPLETPGLRHHHCEDAEERPAAVEVERPISSLHGRGFARDERLGRHAAVEIQPATKHVTVIALTAHAMDATREGDRRGCDEYEIQADDFSRLFERSTGC